MYGRVASTESFGSVDGPGVRFVIFLQGCKMRCRFCHNPETWSLKGGKLYSADELLNLAERYRPYWKGEGGITVSGGESLLQIDFLLELFKKAKERGIHTTLDTSAQPFCYEEPFYSTFKETMKYTDLVLLDIKHIDEKEHQNLTGWSNRPVLEMAEWLDRHHKPVWIRHVLVPGITDNDIYLEKTHQYLETLHNIERVEVLPYHTLGVSKYKEMGLTYSLAGVNPPSKERILNAKRILEKPRKEQKVAI